MREKKELETRIASALVYGAVFVVFLILAGIRPIFMSLLWLILAILMAKEMAALLKLPAGHPSRWILLVQSLSFFLFAFYPESWFAYIGQGIFRPLIPLLPRSAGHIALLLFLMWQILCALLHLVASYLADKENGIYTGMRNAGAGFYLALALFAGNYILLLIPYGWTWLTVALVTPWVSDSLAWAVGRKYGTTKIFPTLSPRKSLEGFVAALLGTGLFYIILFFLALVAQPLPFYYVLGYAVLGIVASFCCQMGDLFESALKRASGLKDSGKLIPGHGGILDRFDSSLFMLPFFLLVLALSEFA